MAAQEGSAIKYRNELLRYPNIYDVEGSDELFLASMREITAFHMLHNPTYAKIVKQQGFKLSSLRTTNSLYKIPPLPTLLLKKYSLYSLPQNKIFVKATTSGTSGHKSEVGTDLASFLFEASIALRMMAHYHMPSLIPTNYIVLGYQYTPHTQLGIARSAFAFTLVTPALRRVYALQYNGGTYTLNFNGVLQAIKRYQKQGLPVRILGLPAYLHLFLTTLKNMGLRFKLHPKSMVCLGGGWKQFYSEHADKSELYRLSEEVLGIPESRFVDFFSVVEHPLPYCDCKNHHFHVPVYSRAIIRDAATLQPLPYGMPGILNLLSPLLRSMPLHSILTDDLAILHPGAKCGCGNTAPYFELLGRAGLHDIKTCAAGAAQFIQPQFTL